MLAKDLTELISPKFTEDVLLEILEKRTSLKNIQIKTIELGAESKKGDSYLSTICRFSVKATGINIGGEEENIFIPIITKAIPKNVGRRKTFRSADFFETEIYFYEKVWPMLLEFKRSKKVSGIDEVPVVLSSYFDEENGYIALEDLSYKNFGGIERNSSGLDYAHAVSLLQLLAKFHGLSLACKDQNPKFEPIAAAIKETYFAEHYRNWYKGFQQKLFELFRYAVEKELPPIYLTKLNKLLETDLYKSLCDFCVIRNQFSVVTQGDAWVPNFLVKYVNGKNIPDESVLIDFQLARYTTLSNDLTFFLYACVAEDVLVENWNNLIKEYNNALVKRLSELGSNPNIITLDALFKDIQENALFGIGMGMEAITMSLLEEDEVSDLDLIQGDDAVPIDSVWYVPLFKDAARRKRIAFIIKHGIDNGFIQ